MADRLELRVVVEPGPDGARVTVDETPADWPDPGARILALAAAGQAVLDRANEANRVFQGEPTERAH